LHGSPVLLIVTHVESFSCTLYLMDYSAWPIFRELLDCSIPCLREHQVVLVFEPGAPGHSPDQFRLRWLRRILTGESARSLVLFQKGLLCLPVSLSAVPAFLFGGHRRFQILLDIAWLLLMLVQVSPQISMPGFHTDITHR